VIINYYTEADVMNLFGRMLFAIYAIQVYKDGDGFGYIWNWWHPMAWILAPIVLLIHAMIEGVPRAWRYRYDAGWQMAPYFKQHPEKIRWISRS
jgi:hypothetical protein